MYAGIYLTFWLTGSVGVLGVQEIGVKNYTPHHEDAMETQLYYIFFKALEQCRNNSKSIRVAVNSFGNSLYNKLSRKRGNIVISPISIHSSLSLLALGASRRTLKELLSKLHFKDVDSLKASYTSFYEQIEEMTADSFLSANALFLDKRFDLLEDFQSDARDVFEALVERVDFQRKSEVTPVINNWVAEQTNGTVREIVDKKLIDGQTALIILNAIYFKAKWHIGFDKSDTVKNYKFRTCKGEVKCNMMLMKEQMVAFAEGSSFDTLQLSFGHQSLKMAFFRPRCEDGKTLHDVEKELNSKTYFGNIRKHLRRRKMNIGLPKFKISDEYCLQKELNAIGISDIFKNPDFSNLFSNTVSASVDMFDHRAVIEIDEDGATEAVITRIGIAANVDAEPIPKFVLDRPFLFFVYDNVHEVILIRGRIENPGMA